MKHLPRTHHDIAYITALILVCIVFIFLYDTPTFSNDIVANKKPDTASTLSKTTVEARSAIVFDILKQKILYEKNADTVLPLASLTKVMTALVALENASSTTRITVEADALKEEGDAGLLSGEHWQIKKLIDFTLITSSNDGARAIANGIEFMRGGNFVEKMNTQAKKLGLTSMTFNNPTGLDIDQMTAGGYGSAKDMVKLYEYILKNYPEIFERTTVPKIEIASKEIMHTAINTNITVNDIPSIVASKTGSTDLAGGNLAIIIDAGIQHPIVIVVLGSTIEGRFRDIKNLVGATLDHISLEK